MPRNNLPGGYARTVPVLARKSIGVRVVGACKYRARTPMTNHKDCLWGHKEYLFVKGASQAHLSTVTAMAPLRGEGFPFVTLTER